MVFTECPFLFWDLIQDPKKHLAVKSPEAPLAEAVAGTFSALYDLAGWKGTDQGYSRMPHTEIFMLLFS